jgi:hypothetical protein
MTGKKCFFPSNVLQKVVDMGFPQSPTSFLWRFLTPLVEKRTKTAFKKSQKKEEKGTYLPHLAAIWQISYTGHTPLSAVPFFGAPCPLLVPRLALCSRVDSLFFILRYSYSHGHTATDYRYYILQI